MRSKNVSASLDLKCIKTTTGIREKNPSKDWKELTWTMLAFATLGGIALFLFNFAISTSDSTNAKENAADEQFESNGIANGNASRR
jgi:uncharacterized protein YpmS